VRRSCARATFRFSPDPFNPVEIEGYWYFVRPDAIRYMERHTFAPLVWANDQPFPVNFVGQILGGSWWRGSTFGGMFGSALIGAPQNFRDTYAGETYFTMTPSGGISPSEGVDQVTHWPVVPPFALGTGALLIAWGSPVNLLLFVHSDLNTYRMWTDHTGPIWFEWRPRKVTDHFDNGELIVHNGSAMGELTPTSVTGFGFLTYWQDFTGTLPAGQDTGYVECVV
jgi:hypothetical protein